MSHQQSVLSSGRPRLSPAQLLNRRRTATRPFLFSTNTTVQNTSMTSIYVSLTARQCMDHRLLSRTIKFAWFVVTLTTYLFACNQTRHHTLATRQATDSQTSCQSTQGIRLTLTTIIFRRVLATMTVRSI